MSNDTTEDEEVCSNYNDLLEQDTEFSENEKLFETSSQDKVKTNVLKEPFLLPSISINDKISLCSGLNLSTNDYPKLNENGSAVKLPRLVAQDEMRLDKDGVEWKIDEDVISGSIDNEAEKNDFEHKPRILEESLKKSLKNFDEPRYYLEGESKSTRHLMLEMNEFYLEMAGQLRYLKGGLLNSARKKAKEADNDTTSLSDFESELNKLISSIERDDRKVTENVKILKELKEERNTIHQEIKSLSGESETNENEDRQKSNVKVRKRLDFKEDENEKKVDQQEKETDDDKRKNTQCEGKNFVAKNKELAKEYNMTRHCLTDEEKRRLQVLLSDIDVCEEGNIETSIQEAEEHEKQVLQMKEVRETMDINSTHVENENRDLDDIMSNNGFKFDVNDSEILSNLDLKLIDLRKEETTLVEPPISIDIENFDDLKEAENQGKHWKFQLLQKRLGRIEKSLAEIYSQKEKENEEEKLDEENVARRADIVEEYRQSVCDLSVDIEELEFEESKELEKLKEENENEKEGSNS